MFNEKLFAELEAMSEAVHKLEVETKRTIKDVDKCIETSRKQKSIPIAKLFENFQAMIVSMGINKLSVTLPIYSHDRALCVLFAKNDGIDVTDGYRFGILKIVEGQFILSESSYEVAFEAKENYIALIDAWNDDVQHDVEKRVAEAIKQNLSDRHEKATAELKAANDKYDSYFNK